MENFIFCEVEQCGPSIIIEYNLKTVNILEITFHLQIKVYKPYRQAIDKPIYINKNSNHRPSVLKPLPKAIEKKYHKCQGRAYLTNS